jgi:hypothetical protein
MTKRNARPARGPGTRALARVERQLRNLPVPGETMMPGRVDVIDAQVLTEEVQLGALGLVEVKLTAAEESILNEPVNLADVRMKPSGQPYLSHPTYTKWFNRAFGRLGWTMRPVAKPTTNGNSVVMPYVLLIHGQPAAFAFGEQDYFADRGNREQTFGDAMEATTASAMRRCAKRLGIGLELWDRVWLDAYVHEHCVQVNVIERRKDNHTGQWGEKAVKRWRRKCDAPFDREVGTVAQHAVDGHAVDDDEYEHTQRRSSSAPPAGSAPPRAAGSNAKSGDVITAPQVRRYHAILTNSGRIEQVVQDWLLTKWGYSSSKDIRRGDYDAICRAVEGIGTLGGK